MSLDEQIAQMTNPQDFTRLCNTIFTDIYGHNFQVIDGSRSDGGDGAARARATAIHVTSAASLPLQIPSIIIQGYATPR